MAEDTVLIEPVSSLKFPIIREINWEFCQFCRSNIILVQHSASEFNAFQLNSLSKLTGNFADYQGWFLHKYGISCRPTGNI